MKGFYFAFLTSIVLLSMANGQELANCEESENAFINFNQPCVGNISSNNCVNLDITDSYDFEAKEFTFIWEMGDGTLLEGLNINHCYSQPGVYKVELNLKDPITKVVIKEETDIKVVIKGSFELEMDELVDVRTDINEKFSFSIDFPDSAYQIESTYWDFGDGIFSCEKEPFHYYAQTGTYQRSLLMKLTSPIDTVVLCSTDNFEVKLSDPTAGMLVSAINEIESGSRFLEDKPRYRLMELVGITYEEVERTDELIGSVALRILTFKGNLVFDSGDIYMKGGEDLKSIQNKISESTIELAGTEPQRLNPIFFELDQEELSRKIRKTLDDNIEIMKSLPMLNVGIGVFTSSGGSYNKGLALSTERAGLIKKYLVENGIEEERILVYKPNESRTLINSCITGNCDYVDEALNRRADFKFLDR